MPEMVVTALKKMLYSDGYIAQPKIAVTLTNVHAILDCINTSLSKSVGMYRISNL